ncbi:hypothetical protein J3A83DRAFT_3467492 [Scleroderma citrinum]
MQFFCKLYSKIILYAALFHTATRAVDYKRERRKYRQYFHLSKVQLHKILALSDKDISSQRQDMVAGIFLPSLNLGAHTHWVSLKYLLQPGKLWEAVFIFLSIIKTLRTPHLQVHCLSRHWTSITV